MYTHFALSTTKSQGHGLMFQINGGILGLSASCGSFSIGVNFVQMQHFQVLIFTFELH